MKKSIVLLCGLLILFYSNESKAQKARVADRLAEKNTVKIIYPEIKLDVS